MTLTELRYLVSLARLKHFGRAAEYCHVTQPTLSIAVKKLEEELGVPLFGLVLTFGMCMVAEEWMRRILGCLRRRLRCCLSAINLSVLIFATDFNLCSSLD